MYEKEQQEKNNRESIKKEGKTKHGNAKMSTVNRSNSVENSGLHESSFRLITSRRPDIILI